MSEKNVEKALKLAEYYSCSKNPFLKGIAIDWLCHAKDFLGENSLRTVMDLDQFLLQFQWMDSSLVFYSKNREILEAIGRSPSICSIICTFNGNLGMRSIAERAENLGRFLSTAPHIKKVRYSLIEVENTPNSFVQPVIEALQVNTSIEEFNFDGSMHSSNNQQIKEKMISSILSNPNSKVKKVNDQSL